MSAAAQARVIDLATRVQRRRDFAAHLSGYVTGLVVLTAVRALGADGTTTVLVAALVWATALSFQHFRHVLRGPVTPEDVVDEDDRLAATTRWQLTHPHGPSATSPSHTPGD